MALRPRSLSFVTLGVLVVAVVVIAPRTSGGLPAVSVDELTLEQQVGQLVLLSFKGTTVPEYVLTALRKQRAAGVILFHGNVAGPGQLRALTRRLRMTGGRPIVAVDQEGGAIRTVGWAPPFRSEPEQTAAGTVRADAETAARTLRSLGITVSLAPVGDVPSVSGAALARRAFSRDPTTASRAMSAAVEGWRSGGLASTAKHFPGLGGARLNTDRASVRIRRTRRDLEATDLPPFEAAIRAGVPLVMVGHARYPAFDRRHVASQSRSIIDGVLRGDLGFGGVVITDSMEAKASLATGDITTVSEGAVRAGADLVLLTGRGSYAPVYRHLLSVAGRSQGFRERVRESAARVLALKRRSE
jgi:beta-N-acetylhexosaminidase